MLHNMKGQALVETAIFMPILVLIAFMLFWAVNMVFTKHQLLTASRYGSDLIYYTRLDEKEIRNKIRYYLTDKDVSGRRLDSRKLRINVTLRRSGNVLDVDKLSSVEVRYPIIIPHLLLVMARMVGIADAIDDSLYLRSRSAVLAGFHYKDN